MTEDEASRIHVSIGGRHFNAKARRRKGAKGSEHDVSDARLPRQEVSSTTVKFARSQAEGNSFVE
jgi:hypothetical protein